MNRIQKLFKQQAGIPCDRTYDFALRRLCVAKEDSWRGIVPSNYSSDYNPEPPILSAKFANCAGYRHILAIANEDGKIALQDTTRRNSDVEERPLEAPQCHFNAVFDLEWAPGQMKFVSASGDHTARLWEVVNSDIRSLRIFSGHTRSVKTAAFRKSDESVFATGGRDGAIIIWDTRANLNVDLTPRADNCIYSGHVGGPGTPLSHKKRLRTTPRYAPNVTSSSITGLVFQDTNTLISCGAGDGIIKVWDLRRNYTAYKKEPMPRNSLPYAGSSTFKGFTNLLIDEMGARLYANCMDNTIYCYNIFSYAPQPLAQYKGLLNSTFYIKSCLSPDGKYLLSGSSDEKAYIWNLEHAAEPLVSLHGHAVEVTCVAWGATHDRPIVTCSDDARHKIWRIGPECGGGDDDNDNDGVAAARMMGRAELYRGHAQYVRVFGQQQRAAATAATHKYNLRDLESTPRSLRRLVEQNERTPSTLEKISTKRSFLEMLSTAPVADAAADEQQQQQESKRSKTHETRGRRLFGASSAAAAAASNAALCCNHLRNLNIAQLGTIAEERCCPSSSVAAASTVIGGLTTSPLSRHHNNNNNNIDYNQENATLPCAGHEAGTTHAVSVVKYGTITTPSPLSERAVEENHNFVCNSSPNNGSSNNSNVVASSNAAVAAAAAAQQQHSAAAAIYSPTTNLPNYVLDGEAPHLATKSPKRMLKDKVDWLTKIRKQKLLSSCRSINALTDKRVGEERMEEDEELSINSMTTTTSAPPMRLNGGSSSTRCALATPRRRISHSAAQASPTAVQHTPKTPTSSRRHSETTILRFFSVQQQQNIAASNTVTTPQAAAAATAVTAATIRP